MSIVCVLSSATSSSSSSSSRTYWPLSTVALDLVLVLDHLAGLGVDHLLRTRLPVSRLMMLKRMRLDVLVAG